MLKKKKTSIVSNRDKKLHFIGKEIHKKEKKINIRIFASLIVLVLAKWNSLLQFGTIASSSANPVNIMMI